MSAYYNEIDPFAAQWLRNLIAAGHIASGEVDERTILEVDHHDLRGFDQCHFFAGIGVWSYALRCAGWSDARPVWTGSCPCQPFSAAGSGKEFADERHLWPAWFELIRECRPVAIFGEQVASRDALAWLDHVCADLEGEGYAVGAVDTCAAGYGAPHIRQRLYWVADADDEARIGRRDDGPRQSDGADQGEPRERLAGLRATSDLADDNEGRREIERPACGPLGLGNPIESRSQGLSWNGDDGHRPRRNGTLEARPTTAPSATNGFWADAEWLPCRDGKARPTEPGTFPLVAGTSSRVGRLRAYGNSIVAPQAAEFVRAFIQCRSVTS